MASRQTAHGPLAYLISFHTYGSWLHGHPRGSVDREHNRVGTDLLPADRGRFAAMRRRSKAPATKLDGDRRRVVQATVKEVCDHRGWELLASHVRSTHVHAVVVTIATPERVMNDLKSYATRRLREAGLVDAETPVWSRHGSTRYLWTDESVEQACDYVVHGQGRPLD